MPPNPFAPTLLLHWQFPSDPPISLCNSTAMSLPSARTFCGTPPLITPSHDLAITQPATDGSFILLLTPRTSYLSRIQKLFNHLRDLHLFCSCLSNIMRNVCRRSTRPFNRSTKTWRQSNLIGGHYRLSSFNFRMTLNCCAFCFSLRLDYFLSVILPLTTPLPVHQLTITLTLLEMPSCFPVLLTILFVVLTRRALWDQPEWKQTTP